jgi:predicted dienelactone hydrolase
MSVTRFTRPPFRIVLCVLLAMATGGAAAAGYSQLEIPATGKEAAIAALVWTPCVRASEPQTIGPLSFEGTADCPVAGDGLPLIVVSHGYGGSFLGHHDTATALADAGFVVVSFNHPGDNARDRSNAHRVRIFETRPLDVSRIITFMTRDWSERGRLDARAVGVFGFSRGAYAALAVAGAVPSTPASAKRFCQRGSAATAPVPCGELADAGARLQPVADTRVRAVVAADPLNLFDGDGLHAMRVPVQLWASELGGDGVERAHVEELRAGLPPAVDYRRVDGAGHFAFLAPCPTAIAQSAPEICRDPEGFSRQAWHREFNSGVVSFFRRTLLPGSRPSP